MKKLSTTLAIVITIFQVSSCTYDPQEEGNFKAGYINLVKESKQVLKKYAKENNPWPEDSVSFSVSKMPLGTYHNCPIRSWVIEHEGDTVELEANQWSYSDYVMCVAAPVSNDRSFYITIALNKTNGGQSSQGRYINDWEKLEKTIPLKGVVEIDRY